VTPGRDERGEVSKERKTKRAGEIRDEGGSEEYRYEYLSVFVDKGECIGNISIAKMDHGAAHPIP
jgi:hypothetical protein